MENGQLAINAVENNRFDLVLMDIHMPVMDGIEAQREINQVQGQLPVIALTANIMVEDVEKYLAQGFVSHLGKPFEKGDLFTTLKKYLQ